MKMKINDDQPLLSRNDFREVTKQYRENKLKLPVIAKRFLIKHQLKFAIPRGKKYKVLRRMARLFDRERVVRNYKLAQCITSRIRNARIISKKFLEKDYKDGKSLYDEKISNRFKLLRKYWKPINYTAVFGKNQSIAKYMGGSR